jgi:preprotein translocase subunit SecG
MIFAAINWLSLSITLLLVVFVAVCLLMALLVLMQRPKQEGLGAAFGGGVTDQVFGARTTNVLQKGTVVLGSLFFLLSLTLAVLIGKQNKQKSLLAPEKPIAAVIENQAAPVVVTPEKPASLVGELPTEETPAPETTPTEETPTPPVTEEAPAPPTTEEAPAQPAPQENTGDKTE